MSLAMNLAVLVVRSVGDPPAFDALARPVAAVSSSRRAQTTTMRKTPPTTPPPTTPTPRPRKNKNGPESKPVRLPSVR